MNSLPVVTPKLKYKNGKLYFENVDLTCVVSEFGTPVYVYSKNQIIENLTNYDSAFGKRDHLICYAMKANSNFHILNIIKSSGYGVDITSGGELFRALNAGIDPQKIVFAGVGKQKEEIEFAIKSKIFMINIESKDEVEIISVLCKKKRNINLSVRINPEVTTKTHSYISTGEEGTKFGIPINSVIEFCRFVKSKNLSLEGLHFHIGSQITILEPFILATKKVCSLLPSIKSLGFNIKYIDIGGGLGIRYKDEVPPTPKELVSKIQKFIPENIKIICEPGRYIVGNSGILISKVIYHKQVKRKNFLIIDASMTDLIRPAFYDAYHNIIPLNFYSMDKVSTYDIAGPVCETSDFLGKNRKLPDIPNGECLVIECAGAYGFAMSSNYNSRLRPAEVMVDRDKYWLIRSRDTYKDLYFKEITTKHIYL